MSITKKVQLIAFSVGMVVFPDSRMKRINTEFKQTAKFLNANVFESAIIVDSTVIIQFLNHTAYKRSCQPQTVYFVRAKLSLPVNSGVIWGRRWLPCD